MPEEKEIDVFYLFGKILVIIKRGKFFIIFITLLSLIFGFYNYFISRNNFRITFTGVSPIVKSELVCEIINDLQKNIDENSESIFEAKLNLKSNEFDKIEKISIDTLQNSGIFRISIIMNDSSALLYFKNKLLIYLNNLEFARKLHLEFTSSNQNLLNEINRKIIQLDSLQEMMLNPVSYNNKSLFVSPYYTEYVEILEKKLKIESALLKIEHGKVFDEFTYNIEKVDNRLIINIFKYGIFGFIVSILLLLVRVSLKKINEYSK